MNDDLYIQCSPSYWSKRFSTSAEVLDYHAHFTQTASQQTRSNIPCLLNVRYGTSDKQKIDIVGTDLPDNSPIFIFIHGGYWQEKSVTKETSHFIAQPLHKNGIRSIFIGYDLCPDVTISEIVTQINMAAKKCLEYAKTKKPRAICFAGHSAGAHLVVSLFADFIKSLSQEERSVIKGVFLISGVFDLSPLQKTAINDLLKLDARMAFELSPLNWTLFVEGTRCTFYTIVGENESGEFLKQSKDFHEKLQKSSFMSEFVCVEDVDHFDIIEKLAYEDYEITKLIVRVLRGIN